MSGTLRTRGLRRRVVGAAVALTGVSMVVVALVLVLTLGDRIRAGIRADLEDRARTALELDGTRSAPAILRRVGGDGVSARIDPLPRGSAGEAVAGPSVAVDSAGYLAVPVPDGQVLPATVQARRTAVPDATTIAPVRVAGAVAVLPTPTTASRAGRMVVRQVLPETGGTLTLSASTSLVGTARTGALQTVAVVGLAVMGLGALLMSRLVGLTLAPLDRMTRLASSIAGGERGQRLRPDRKDTELGRAADAFDGMLDALEDALAEAESAKERLRRFIADASHELRTPLGATAATAETLLRGSGDRARVEELSVQLVRETRRAARLVDDLLAAARLDGGDEVVLRREPADLTALAVEAAGRARAHLGREVAVASEGAAPVLADQGRILQVLANLLDNAFRWSPEGPVSITVGTAGGMSLVHVDDAGPGVPEAERERIFERLVRLQDDRARTSGGAGLGLSISRDLARAHGGDLVCAAVDRGARFTLTVPLARMGTAADPDGGDRRRVTIDAGATPVDGWSPDSR